MAKKISKIRKFIQWISAIIMFCISGGQIVTGWIKHWIQEAQQTVKEIKNIKSILLDELPDSNNENKKNKKN